MRIKTKISNLFLPLMIGAETAVISDILSVKSDSHMPTELFFAIIIICTLGSFMIHKKARRIIAVLIPLVFAVFTAVLFAAWSVWSKNAVYSGVDSGKSRLFAGKRVLIIAPHEDDELNEMSGALNEFVRYGSNIYVCFATNGDFKGYEYGEQRLREAISAMSYCGIPEKNIIFLGYGDYMCTKSGKSFFDSDGETVYTSRADQTKTYGLPEHPAYRNGTRYTLNNMRSDLKAVINEYKADIIVCCDYDWSPDHIGLSMVFDSTIGEILKADRKYRPVVLKSFAYCDSYFAGDDFYCENIRSCISQSLSRHNLTYMWKDRLRLPVGTDTLSRSLYSSHLYRELKIHRSQYSHHRAPQMINGDKIFYQRESGSLSYDASVSVSSGNPEYLTDFVLAYADNVIIPKSFDRATWIPEDSDAAPWAELSFDSPVYIDRIKLYDSPSEDDNVLSCKILIDGKEIAAGVSLPFNGSGYELEFERQLCSKVRVEIEKKKGERAGLSEIELYDGHYDYGIKFIKLMNSRDDFIYDYYIDKSGTEKFRLFTENCSKDLADYEILCEGDGCSAYADKDKIIVSCPKRKKCKITVASADGELSDTVLISNPNDFNRHFFQQAENYFKNEFMIGLHRSNTYIALRRVFHLIK